MPQEGRTTRRLVRRTDDKVVAGVCSGLADHLGVDPLVVRIGFVALALTGGGVLAYLAAWALVPAAGDPQENRAPRTWSLGAVVLAVAGVVTAAVLAGFLSNAVFPLGPLDGFSPEPLGLAALLVVAGILLLRSPDPGATGDAPEATSGTARARWAAASARLRGHRRERSGLTPLTAAAALLVGGTAALAANAGWLALDVGQIAASGLVIVGAGLIAGAWFGRGRLLIAVGILMVPPVLVASLIDMRPSGTIGSDYIVVRNAGDLGDMRVLAGQVTLDLLQYPFSEGTERARLRVGAGSMNVHVPADVYVEVDASVNGGEAYVFGGYEGGLDVSVHDAAGPAGATKRLALEIEAGFGTVGVYRVRTTEPRPNHDARGERRGAGRRKGRR
ncbi:MAG: PspC domain-containing protein [Actinomycetota bacterium]